MISSNEQGLYTCHDCGHTWRRSERWLWWPIRLYWSTQNKSWRRWFRRHGVEAKPDGIERHTFAQVWSFGRLRVILGRYDA